MKAFSALYRRLDETRKTNEKIAALADYFRAADPASAAWAIYFLTGRKLKDKRYRWHTGYIGGLKDISAEQMLRSHPERVIEWAVQGMLPKNRLGRAMVKKLKVYRGASHPHSAQQPTVLTRSTSRKTSAEAR